jgi:hypothetical protein
MSQPIPTKDVEGQLDGLEAGDAKPDPAPASPAKPASPSAKPEGPVPAVIPAELRPTAWMMLGGFLVAFLADFGAREAHNMYLLNSATEYAAPACHSFKLLFYAQMVMGVAFGLCALQCIIPGIDRMFFSLYWQPEHWPAPKSNASLFMRQMGVMLLALNISQIIAPSNTGVGLAALCVSVACGFNFILGSFFGHYHGVRLWHIQYPNPGFNVRLADQFTWGGFVFIGLLATGLERTNMFHAAWKNDSQHGQTWLFYLNTITGLMYMPLAIMLLTPGYKLWFWSFHFKQAPFERRSPVEFLNNNIACMIAGLSSASLIAPNNPGVGIVSFWVHLLLFFVFLAVVAGQHGEVNNKPIWIFWMVNCILFCALFAVALKRADDCDPNDATCGSLADWTEQPWKTHGDTSLAYTGCVAN